MTDSNETVLKRLFEDVWNGHNPSTAEDFVATDYVIHDRDIAEDLAGPALYTALAEQTREIFPDMRFQIEDLVAAEDKVALRWTMTGTHRGELDGIPPTGEEVELAAIEIDRFEGGLLVETWTQSDQLGLMEQIGAFAADD